MDFTIIIPSRNRPVLLRKAIDSVLMQTHPDIEVLVVNDGSDGENEQAYANLATELTGRVRFLNLEQAKNGHGQSGSINRGADAAQGKYLCFLDDDDYWTDPEHLKRSFHSLENTQSEVYFANQDATLGDTPVPGPIWLEPLKDMLPSHAATDTSGSYAVTVKNLMACPGFGHLNTTIVRKSLFDRIGGMDENIRYECDLDFYLRIVDAASGIRYFPGIVSRHFAPDPAKALNMSTAVSYLQKMLFRTYVWDKALLFGQAPVIRKTAARNKSHATKKMAVALAEDQHFKQAFHYARQTLLTGFSFKWLGYCGYLSLRALTSTNPDTPQNSGRNP
jgi:glycosyltransferase involved in cell wall biosynthesis